MNRSFTSYALLGSGRVARHLQFYLQSLNHPATYWSRNAAPEFNSFAEADSQKRLQLCLQEASHLLFAVSDPAIPELAAQALPIKLWCTSLGARAWTKSLPPTP
ncbi:MAG: hypothetical protein HC883_05795 [Bdellovibrionaceae bacterium]|nr:hypothetical protein [Pseudobdellovibrionaceae bacterium]